MNDLQKALIDIQTRLKAPKNLRNSFAGFDYRNAEGILEALKPLLKEYGVVQTVSDEVVNIGSANYIKSTVTIELGELTKSVCGLAREEESLKGQIAAQITGGASSYAKKYALNNMYNIDDSEDVDSIDNTSHKTQPMKSASPSPQASSNTGLATDKQRTLIKQKLAAIGLTSDQEMKNYLLIEHGIVGKLTKDEASQVIEHLISEQ